MSGPQFEQLESSADPIEKEVVVNLGRLCYKCEERYPCLFRGLMKEVKMNIMDGLLSSSPNTPSATVTNFRRIIETIIARPVIRRLGLIPWEEKLVEYIKELKRIPVFNEIIAKLNLIRNLGNSGAHGTSTVNDVNDCINSLSCIITFFLELDFETAAMFIYNESGRESDSGGVPDSPQSNGGIFEPYFINEKI